MRITLLFVVFLFVFSISPVIMQMEITTSDFNELNSEVRLIERKIDSVYTETKYASPGEEKGFDIYYAVTDFGLKMLVFLEKHDYCIRITSVFKSLIKKVESTKDITPYYRDKIIDELKFWSEILEGRTYARMRVIPR